jgi:hypothetical protein
MIAGELHRSDARRADATLRDLSDPFAVFVQSEPALKRSKLGQAVIDGSCVLVWLLLGSAGVIAVVGSFAACFFVSF